MMSSDAEQPASIPYHNTLDALTFLATSAEYYVLCLQNYRLARATLMERLERDRPVRACVIMDLDETVFNNLAYQAWLVATGRNFSMATWDAWCNDAEATLIPGALEFIQAARKMGVTPFFVTSRNNTTRAATVRNLIELEVLTGRDAAAEAADEKGQPERTMVFMAGMEPVAANPPRFPSGYPMKDKFEQRVYIQEVRGYEIELSIGDNLADYAEYYGAVTNAAGERIAGHPTFPARMKSAQQDTANWGYDFVLIPNPVYGGWLRAFAANCIGSVTELESSDEPVRGPLLEEQGAVPGNTQCPVTAAPRFPQIAVPWAGPKTP